MASSFWPTFGDCGEKRSIAEIAAEHLDRTGRSLRIAVDEAHWRFQNVNPTQVKAIRKESGRPSNPLHKNILHRLLPLLHLSIHFVWVFDGPRRLHAKRDSILAASQLKLPKELRVATDAEEARLLKDILQALRIPCHDAPAEAEAECVKMATLGKVDAVWSEDSDTLMFGCPLLFKTVVEDIGEKGKGQKSKTHVTTYKLSRIEEQYGVGQTGLIMFALLVGCDADIRGLPDCGAQKALEVAKSVSGSSGLCPIQHQHDVSCWRRKILELNLVVPANFPRTEVIDFCSTPIVSSSAMIRSSSDSWEKEWAAPITRNPLQDLLKRKFNLHEGEWFQKIDPLIWVKSLMSIESKERTLVQSYTVESVAKRSQAVSLSTTTVRFWPRMSIATVKGKKIEMVEFETLSAIVNRAPQGTVTEKGNPKRKDSSPQASKKRANPGGESTDEPPKKRRGRPSGSRNKSTAQSSHQFIGPRGITTKAVQNPAVCLGLLTRPQKTGTLPKAL